MFRNLILFASMFNFIFIGLFIPHISAQDDPFAELRELESEIDEELKWIREEAQDFVTVATKTKIRVEQAPSIVTVITGEQIRNMGARNLIDVLRTVPGFDLANKGFYPLHGTYIRGMTSIGLEKLKIMIDGHSFKPFGDTDAFFDRLPIGNISKIEIIRGPGSALYGAGAFLGVISIITKQGGDRPSSLSVEYGSFNSVKPYAELSYNRDELKTYFYTEYYQTDGYDGTVDSDMASDPLNVAMHGGLLAPSASRETTNGAEHSTFHANLSYRGLYFSGFFQKIKTESSVGTYQMLTDEDDMNSRYIYGELGYKLPLDSGGSLELKTYYDYCDYDWENEYYPEETAALHIGFPPDQGIHLGMYGKNSFTGAEFSGNYEFLSGIQIAAGTSYEYIKNYDIETYANANITGDYLTVGSNTYDPFPFEYFPDGYTDISENGNWSQGMDRGVFSGYIQLVSDLRKIFSLKKNTESLIMTLGGRYDHYDDVGSTTNPRFGISYAPSEKLWFKGLYGSAFRAPHFYEMLSNSTTSKGNTDLRPEKIKTVEALIGYNFTKHLSGTVTGFHVTAEDLIRYTESTYKNIGQIESLGLETEFRYSSGKNFYAWLNFTWQDVKDTTGAVIEGTDQVQGDFSPGMVPVFYGNAGINYGFTENIIGNISLNYVGKKDRSEENIWDGEKIVRKDDREPLDERWLLNMSLRFKNIFTEGMEFQITGFNLLNEDHRDPDSSGYVLNDIPCPGTTFTGKLSYTF